MQPAPSNSNHLALTTVADPEARVDDVLRSAAELLSEKSAERIGVQAVSERLHRSLQLNERYLLIRLLQNFAESPSHAEIVTPIISEILKKRAFDGVVVMHASRALEAFGIAAVGATESLRSAYRRWQGEPEAYPGEKRRDEVVVAIGQALFAVDPLGTTTLDISSQMRRSARRLAKNDQADAGLLDKIFGRARP